MGINVPDSNATADKWASRTAGATSDYTKGVNNPSKDWATETQNAAPNYQQAVQASDIGTRYKSGVRKAGSDKWKRNAVNLGAGRFAAGVNNAKDAYNQAEAPYLSNMAGLTLPERQPRGSPANLDRVRAIAESNHAKRIALAGAGA